MLKNTVSGNNLSSCILSSYSKMHPGPVDILKYDAMISGNTDIPTSWREREREEREREREGGEGEGEREGGGRKKK